MVRYLLCRRFKPGSEISAIWKRSTFLEPHTRCVETQGTDVQEEYSWRDIVVSFVICDRHLQEEQFAAPVKTTNPVKFDTLSYLPAATNSYALNLYGPLLSCC